MQTQFTINMDSLKPSQLEALANAVQLVALSGHSEDFPELWQIYKEIKFAGVSNEGERDFFIGMTKANEVLKAYNK